jgi:hypothetical protein
MNKLIKKALIIGNSEYKNTTSLKNPENDSNDLSKSLKEIEFDITINNNLTRRNFDKLVKNFSKQLIADSADIVIFFYSGHAIQYQGENYLIPTDSLIETPRDICAETISLSHIIEEFNFTSSKLNLFILDSCRDNPFEEKMLLYSEVRNIEHIKLEKGLSNKSIEQFSISSSKSQNPFLIAFPTGAGDVAYDFEFPEDRNGLYTKYLLQVIQEKHSNLYQYFDRLSQLVSSAKTPTIQNPVTYGAIKGCKFTFSEIVEGDTSSDEVHQSEIREEIMETNPLNIIDLNSEKYLWIDFTNKLMWEIKKPDNIDERFSFEDAESEVNHLNEISFLHFNNWRIPTLKELQTLLSVEVNDGYHIIRPFSQNTKLAYWTATDSEDETKQDYKKILNFKSEKHSDYKKTHKVFLRYVRTMTNFELPQYLQLGNNEKIKFHKNILIWIDKENKIMWEVKTEKNYRDKFTYSEAIRHIKKLNDTKYLGYQDWKLPNNHELSILSKNRKVIEDILPELPCYWSAYVKNDHNGIPMYYFTCLNDEYKHHSKDLNVKYHLIAVRSCQEKICK